MIHDNVLILKHDLVTIDDTARVDSYCKIEGGLGVRIGKGVHVSSFAHLNIGGGLLVVGDYVALTSGVRVVTGSNTAAGLSMSSASPVEMQVVERKEVVIDDYAFVGAGATILPGVHIGRFAIVGAGSVVTKDVKASEVVMGIPARVVGHRCFDTETGEGFIAWLPKLRDLAAQRDIDRVRQRYGDAMPEAMAVDLVEAINALTMEVTG